MRGARQTCAGRRLAAIFHAHEKPARLQGRVSLPMSETGALRDDPLWFKDAVFYEIYVRGFYDSNGDGVGDFAGLTEKLDYLEWLGVDCLWLLPMYASPLRDGGYDIADYYSILPEYGTLEDFRAFIDAAHARGIRVITDLVVNHTSDQHPWFKEASSSPDSPRSEERRVGKECKSGVSWVAKSKSIL